jgi:hypothetical protein
MTASITNQAPLIPVKHNAMQRLITALAERLVQDHLHGKLPSLHEKPATRPNQGRVARAAKAA